MVSSLPRYCTNCGAANQPQAGFCFACGQTLALVADATPLSSAAIFSLGAVLHQLLTGADPSQALFQFAPLNLHRQAIPAGLETLLTHMLEKDASKRPTSMTAVKQELQRIAARVPAKQGISQPGPLPQKTIIRRLSQPSKAKFMGLMVLTLLVVSGIGFFSLVHVNQVTTTHANATTTAKAHATATTAAFYAITPTANATATISTTGLQNVYNSATRGTPALGDPLRDNSKGNSWDEGTNTSGGTCSFKGGIIFRANTASNTSYVFVVRQVGYYQLTICGVNNCYDTMVGGTSSAIKQGLNQTNLIAVIAQGSTIGLYVNHQLIDGLVDNNYSSGQIGVIASLLGIYGPTEAVYSNAKVWTV